MNTYSRIQEEIIGLIKNTRHEGKSWSKYNGDVYCRIFRKFLSKEIPKGYTISLPSAYIVGFPTEFDFLVLDRDARPEKYTNSFQPEKVRCGFEIKARGVISKREALEKRITAIRQKFEEVRCKHPHVNFVYLTYEEATSPKRQGSIDYLRETRKILKPYRVFCLRDSRRKKPISGAWRNLVNYLKDVLQ